MLDRPGRQGGSKMTNKQHKPPLLSICVLFFIFCSVTNAAKEDYIGLSISHKGANDSRIIGGLGWQATVEKDGLRLGKSLNVCMGGHNFRNRKPDWADLGLFYPENAAGTLEVTDTSWATAVVTANGFKAYVTRLSPAVLLETEHEKLRIFEGAKIAPYGKIQDERTGTRVPRYFATATDKGITPANAADLAELFSNASPVRWLLAWYGPESRLRAEAGQGRRTLTADLPVLLVFGKSPEKCLADDKGITLTFSGSSPHRLAILSALGEQLVHVIDDEKPARWPEYIRHPGVDNEVLWSKLPPTDKWIDTLPEEVIAQCNWWADHLQQFPISVTEDFEYDAQSDELSVTGRTTFLQLGDHGKPMSPLPTMLALAAKKGLSLVKIDGDIADSGQLTKWGPYCGIENSSSYTYKIKGLGRYAFEIRAVPSFSGEPQEIRNVFEKEVQKVIDAGIMAPWFTITNAASQIYVRSYAKDRHRMAFSNPGENLYFIGQCCEVANPDQRKQLLDLAIRWQKKYPAERIVHMPKIGDAGREHYFVHYRGIGSETPNRGLNFHYLNNLVPCENTYYLSDYYRRTEQKPHRLPDILGPWAARGDWASFGFLRAARGRTVEKEYGGSVAYKILDIDAGRGSVDEINRYFAGAIGHTRLAKMLDDGDELRRGIYHLARAAVLRYAMTQWRYYLYEQNYLGAFGDRMSPRRFYGMGVHSWHNNGPEDDAYVFYDFDELEVSFTDTESHFWQRTRLIPYLNMVPELGRFLAEHLKKPVTAYINKTEDGLPEWYKTYADCIWAGEQYCIYPEDPYQLFLARAWIVGDSPQKLWKYADLPYLGRGDWYYIHKVAETIKAYRSARWKPLN